MFAKLLNHLRHQYLGAIALFVALGGSAYAATALPAGSVGSKQLRRGAVTQTKLAKGSVTAAALNPKSIAGHITLWASVAANGKVISSSPRATAVSGGPPGVLKLSWKRAISLKCAVVASPMNASATEAASASTAGPFATGRSTYLLVSSFQAGTLSAENVSVLVVCP
jgi:hypothetical protein